MEDWKSHIMTPNSEPLSILSAYMDRIIKYTRTSSAPGTTNHKLLITYHQSLFTPIHSQSPCSGNQQTASLF